MKEITLTIDGKEVKGKEGDTILDVCRANGIDVPTLCHYDGLSDVGACRMCVVEVERERRPVPSCTYPIRDGMVINTKTEKLEKYRRLLLELIFTERNHFCMFCEQSGNCELQKLAYQYQMDNVRYTYSSPVLPMDTISDYLVIDHNRCILCGRCVRACNEVSGSHTLDFSQRGEKTMISADMQQPLGESSCFSCGSCVQACPTGAIFNKVNLYKGKPADCKQVRTTCPSCGVGCELNVFVKDNNVVKIESPKLTTLHGSLCNKGRFGLIEPTPKRIKSPMVRSGLGRLEKCDLDKAGQVISGKIAELKGSFAGLTSTRLPSETLTLFDKFMTETVGTKATDTLDGAVYRAISDGTRQFKQNVKAKDIESPLQDILEADCIMVVGDNPEVTNPIAGTLIRRASGQKQAKLIVINAVRDVFWLKPKAGSEKALLDGITAIVSGSTRQELIDEVVTATGISQDKLEEAAEMYGKAERGFIIYGSGMLNGNGADVAAAVLKLADTAGNRSGDKLRVTSLKPGANSCGAWDMGIARGLKGNEPKGLYLFLSDDAYDETLLEMLEGIEFLVVQASYQSLVTAMAHVVLPASTWAEREGTYVNMDGEVLQLNRVIQPAKGLLQDAEILTALSASAR